MATSRAILTITVLPPKPDPEPDKPLPNCDCDDDTSGYSTLGALRTELLYRLGFADPIESAELRTLGAMRRDLMARLGYAAQAGNPPPGMLDLLDSLVNESEQMLWRRLELDRGGQPLPPRMVAPDQMTTLDAPLVFALALASAKSHYNQPDAKLYVDMAERALADYVRRRPPGIIATLTSFLHEAQEQLYRRYDVLRTERYFSWPITAGVRMYDIPGNQEACSKRLDPRKVTWVGVEVDGAWSPLECGIPPETYSRDETGRPQRYEIRQCIELSPVPDETRGRLIIRGRFGLEPFETPDDRTTIDDRLVFLMALANAKAHFQQQDGQNYIAQLETMLRGMVAGAHHTRRYVPGQPRRVDAVYAIPRPTEPFR
ncbi:hypothetical protein ABE488_00720 [Luteimonas sp. TWI662]|uniref:phage adaptor protein n=1 Tax=Luteimonas sp. TWI662 TaxID=3136789 RepID=UPI003208D73D